jgi:hypothetical protein
MRLMIVTDSHGKGMKTVIEGIRPDWIILEVVFGRKTSELLLHFQERHEDVVRFCPDVTILHSGHNDVVAHHRYNPEPTHTRQLLPQLVEFVHLIDSICPDTTVYLSCMFPPDFGGTF